LHRNRAAAALEAAGFPVLFKCLSELVHVDAAMAEKPRIFAEQNRLLQVVRDRPVGHPDLLARDSNVFLLVFLVAQLHQCRTLGIFLFQDVDVGESVIETKNCGDDRGQEQASKENFSHGMIKSPRLSASSMIRGSSAAKTKPASATAADSGEYRR